MIKQTTLLLALAATLLISSSAQASSSELKVTGKIVPSACAPAFTFGGVVNYGTISSDTLKSGAFTELESRKVSLTVTCPSETQVALVFTDNRADSKVDGITGPGAVSNFGLGSVSGSNIGGYDIRFDNIASVDANSATTVKSTDSGKTWSSYTSYADNAGTYVSWAHKGYMPLTGKVFNLTMNVRAVINKPENLPLTQSIPLDGSATVEVRYL